MKITKNGFKKINLAIAFFLAFAGFYVVIMVMQNLGMRDSTRLLTIPMRLLIVGCIGLAYFVHPKIRVRNGLIFFLVFSFFYYMRIVFETLKGSSSFHIPAVSFFLYFTSFVFLPILLVSQISLNKRNYTLLFYAIIVGCLLMAIGTYFYYSNLIGEVTRISLHASENNTSPLALSYTSALGMGVGISYLLTNKAGRVKKIIIYVTIVLCLIPFFLGASRGSIFALFLPFGFYFLFQKGFKRKVVIISALVIIAVGIIIVSQYLGLGPFERLSNHGIGQTTGLSRLDMWKSGWHQFLENPFFGNSLALNITGIYPHNVLVETLITTGILGFSTYLLFLFFTIKRAIRIIKYDSSKFFIVVIFLQALMKNMVSGGVYTTSWLAIGAGLILGYNFRKKLI